MLDGDFCYYKDVMDEIYCDVDGGDDFYKVECCCSCTFDDCCVGVRCVYVEVHGDDEICSF